MTPERIENLSAYPLFALRALRDGFASRLESCLLGIDDAALIRADIDALCWGPDCALLETGTSFGEAHSNLLDDCRRAAGGHYCVQAAENVLHELTALVRHIYGVEKQECAELIRLGGRVA